MFINLYNVTNDPREVNKNLSNVIRANAPVYAYDETSIMNPTFLLDYGSSVNANYVGAWGQYYFIADKTAAPGGRVTLHCTKDVLMSNADAIRSLDAYVVRSESRGNSLVVDSMHPSQANRYCLTRSFSNAVFNALDTDYCYLLTVIGGGTSA